MTTVRIAHVEPWPGQRPGGRGFRIASFLVVLADEAGGRAMPVWLSAPDGHAPAEPDLIAQFTRDVAVPKRHRRFPHLFRAHPQPRMAAR